MKKKQVDLPMTQDNKEGKGLSSSTFYFLSPTS